jgi:hypothetical protein
LDGGPTSDQKVEEFCLERLLAPIQDKTVRFVGCSENVYGRGLTGRGGGGLMNAASMPPLPRRSLAKAMPSFARPPNPQHHVEMG